MAWPQVQNLLLHHTSASHHHSGIPCHTDIPKLVIPKMSLMDIMGKFHTQKFFVYLHQPTIEMTSKIKYSVYLRSLSDDLGIMKVFPQIMTSYSKSEGAYDHNLTRGPGNPVSSYTCLRDYIKNGFSKWVPTHQSNKFRTYNIDGPERHWRYIFSDKMKYQTCRGLLLWPYIVGFCKQQIGIKIPVCLLSWILVLHWHTSKCNVQP